MTPVSIHDEPDPEEAILRYLIDLPGVFLAHSGVTLFHHLLGTYRVLKSWSCDEDLCIAGLFHSVYGTPAFPEGPLTTGDRDQLKKIIGAQAENLVHQFSQTNWTLLFSDQPGRLRELSKSLLTLAAANLVEQRGRLGNLDLGGRSMQDALRPFEMLIPFLDRETTLSLTLVLEQTETESKSI
jgi:hypothetical protein